VVDDAFMAVEAAAGTALMATGLDRVVRRLNRSAVPILMYHSVAADSAAQDSCMALAGMVVRESRFREHMAYVARHYTTITLTEYMERRGDGRPLPPNPCVVTFDDGFADTRQRVVPILGELGLTGTSFVIGATLRSGGNGSAVGSWLHELYVILDSVSTADASSALARLVDGFPSSASVSKPALRGWARRRVAELGPPERAELLERLRAALGVPRVTWHMDEVDLGEVASAGFEIGSHSMSHDYLARMPNGQLADEVAESLKVIDPLLGRYKPTFCYPFGGTDSFDERTVRELRRSGFVCAVSSIEGLNRAGTDPYALRRIRVTGDPPLAAFVFRLLGFRALPWKAYGALSALRAAVARA
jgi:peptidoglycan/xylan/chitin deacetylase (PgdA/CDA1 family)